MKFKNTEIKIDQLVSYLNDGKINLSPVFQRGHVWKVAQRKGLIQNILLGRPIPAIFLFKKSDGSKYLYNILDGKQRIESILLFINDKRPDLCINNWTSFVYGDIRKQVNFPVDFEEKKQVCNNLSNDVIRDFREYTIPTIEIALDDDTEIDEIISLFVDINQQGVPVSRFDIVKAMCRESKILKKAFSLVSTEQRRGDDVFYQMKDSNISKVLKQLSLISRTADQKNKVDKIWQKTIEVLIFTATKEHHKPSDILKGFISQKDKLISTKIDTPIIRQAQSIFAFYWKLYKKKSMLDSPIAKDQTHFYTSITSIIKFDFLSKYGEAELMNRMAFFNSLLQGTKTDKRFDKNIKQYKLLSESHTTDSKKRTEREIIFKGIIEGQ
jgi:hypothetical protein